MKKRGIDVQHRCRQGLSCGMAILLSAIAGATAAAETLSLQQALDSLKTRSPWMAPTEANLAAKAEALMAAERANYPEFKATVRPGYGDGEPTSFFAIQNVIDPDEPTRDSTSGDYVFGSVSVSMPLYTDGSVLGRNSGEKMEAQANYKQSQAQGELDLVDLSTRVAKAYYSALQAREERDKYAEIHQRRERQLRMREGRVEARLATRAEQLALEYALASSTEGMSSAASRYELNLQEIADYIGAPPDTVFELADLEQVLPVVPSLDQQLTDIVTTHPQVQVQEAKVASERARLRSAEAQKYPEVTLTVSEVGATNFDGDETTSFFFAGVDISYTFLDFGKVSSKSNSRRYSVTEQERLLTLELTQRRRQVLSARHNVVNALQKYETAKKELQKTEFEETQKAAEYRKALTGLDELIDAENAKLNAGLRVTQSRYTAWVAYAELLNVMGLPQSKQAAELMQ